MKFSDKICFSVKKNLYSQSFINQTFHIYEKEYFIEWRICDSCMPHGGARCSQKADEQLVSSSEEISTVESVKSELETLNLTYMEPATKAKWWRYLLVAAADAAGGLLGGGVTGGVAASTLVWNVTSSSESSSSSNGSGFNGSYNRVIEYGRDLLPMGTIEPFKDGYLDNLEVGSIGYIHNSVIANTYNTHKDLYSKSYEEILRLTLEELEKQTGEMLSEVEKTETINSTISMFASFDASKSVEEYIGELIEQTSDTDTKAALELCGLVLQGLQYVDDDDTTYIEKATSIVSESDLNSELKSTVLDGMSIAYASAKLWNTASL